MPRNLDKEKRIKLGANVRRCRKKKNWTQKKLAKKAKVYVATIGKMERGEVDSRFFSVCAMADALRVNLNEFRK